MGTVEFVDPSIVGVVGVVWGVVGIVWGLVDPTIAGVVGIVWGFVWGVHVLYRGSGQRHHVRHEVCFWLSQPR